MDDSKKMHPSPSDKGGDGVRIIERGSRGSRSVMPYIMLALILVACFAGYLVKMAIENAPPGNSVTRSDLSAANASNTVAPSSEETSTRGHALNARPSQAQAPRDPNDLANYVAPGQAPPMEEVIERLHDAGIHTGLGAFNPPGTSPPMIGLAVPDDYVLPEGYVRHFQATDDGQRIEPILMYSPDFEFFDSNGQPISIPANRVVPGNMAPPGFVIRPIEIPRPLEPGKP